jgi:hypothetical protein
MTDQTTNQAHHSKFIIVRRPQSVTLRQVFGDETRDLRPFLMQADQIQDLAKALDMDLDPTDVASEATLGSHRIDLLVGIKSAGEGGNTQKVAFELQLKPADMPHLRKVLHGALCDASIGASVWIAPSFGPDMLRDLAIAQSRLTKPLIALEMIPTTSGDGNVWFDYVRVNYGAREAASELRGQGAIITNGTSASIPSQTGQTRNGAREGHQGQQALKHSNRHSSRQNNVKGQGRGQDNSLDINADGLWARLANLLNKYQIKASPGGVGRHNQPHCAVGLGRKGAKLVIQLQNKSTKLVMRVELEPEVADLLRPTFRALEDASGERFKLIPNDAKRKHYQIQVPASHIDRRANPEDQERIILAFGHRVDKMRTAFRDQLMDVTRHSQDAGENPAQTPGEGQVQVRRPNQSPSLEPTAPNANDPTH